MKTKHLFPFILLLATFRGFTQTSVDINITKDAFVETKVNDTVKENTNFGSHALAPAHAWTAGDFFLRRYIFDIDLSSIPPNSIILTADLYMFSNGNHDPYTKPNDASLKEVTGSWDETGVNGITWNKHWDLAKTGDSVVVPGSDTSGTNQPNLDYIIDINSIIGSNFQQGQYITSLRLQLNTEEYYTKLMFCSSDHTDPNSRPFVRISYSPIQTYAELHKKLDGSYYKCHDGKLNIKCEENYYLQNGSLNITFYDSSNNLIYQPTDLNSNTGVSLYEIDLQPTSLFTNGQYYIAQVEDSKGNQRKLRFQYND